LAPLQTEESEGILFYVPSPEPIPGAFLADPSATANTHTTVLQSILGSSLPEQHYNYGCFWMSMNSVGFKLERYLEPLFKQHYPLLPTYSPRAK